MVKISDDLKELWRPFMFLMLVALLLIDPLDMFPASAAEQSNAPPAPSQVADPLPAPPNVANNPNSTPPDAYQSITNTLAMVFILAVLIEVGLAVLFRWRTFLRVAEGKIGWKVPIAFGVSYIVVLSHGIDLPADVVGAFNKGASTGNPVGEMISALIIAGGSASVNGVFQKLGWRNPVLQQDKLKQDREKTHAWLVLTVTRAGGSSSIGKQLTVTLDKKAFGTIPSDQDKFGAATLQFVAPGSHEIGISWMDGQGNKAEATPKQVTAVAGAPLVESFSLS